MLICYSPQNEGFSFGMLRKFMKFYKKEVNMKNNVLNFKKEVVTPDDLLSFKEFASKHNMKIGYLYKLFERGKIKRFKRGIWKISERETLTFLNGVC